MLEKIYSAFLLLYPRDFRRLFGDRMRADFRALLRAERTRRGRLIRTAREVWDVAASAVVERLGLRDASLSNESPARRARLSGLAIELRHALRGLRRSPGFVLAVVGSLGLALGAVIAIFAVGYGVLLKPLPYTAPEKLVFVWDGLDQVGVPRAWVTGPEVVALRDRTTSFDGFAALDMESYQVLGDGDPQQVEGAAVSTNLFRLLGVTPALGRDFLEEESWPGGPAVAILSHDEWLRRFSGEPEAVGAILDVDGVPTTVIGVMPKDFEFVIHTSLGDPQHGDLWLPLQLDLEAEGWGNHFLAVLGRVSADADLDLARADLARLSSQIDADHYRGSGFEFRMVALQPDLVADVRTTLWLLFGAAALLLLLGTSNVATLLLARARRQEEEQELRRALGASWLRSFARPVLEGTLLGLAAAGVGVVLAHAGLGVILALAGERIPRADGIEVGGAATTLMIAAAVGVVVLGSLATALHQLRSATPGLGSRPRGRGLGPRRALIVGQMAAAVVLSFGAVVLLQTFRNIQRVDPGFRPDSTLAASVLLPAARYAEPQSRVALVRDLTEELAGAPGVEALGFTTALPLGADANQRAVYREGVDPETSIADLAVGEGGLVEHYEATPGLLEAVGATLIAGRDLDWRDDAESDPVVLVDRLLAERLYGSAQSAVGRRVTSFGRSAEIVGVIRQMRLYEPHREDRPQVVNAWLQVPRRDLNVVLRSDREPADAAALVRAALRRHDRLLPLADARSLRDRHAAALGGQRLLLTLFGAFALVAVALAAAGILGLLSVIVQQRRSELAVRLALGAQRSAVLGSVLRHTALLAAAGAAAGSLGAGALLSTLRTVLYEVGGSEHLLLLAMVVGLLLAVAVLASLPPATRVLRLDPARSLRADD